ncbi:MAG: hypothetical protein PHI68_00055 [Candidatus Cloacimonetes bacterium]|nr:hypothetical protein [Candidatus Cloacimonadota bacterium]
MNRAFWRPFILIACTILILGAIALLLPDSDSGFFPIKKMHWFDSLKRLGKPSIDEVLSQKADSLHIETVLTPLEIFQNELAKYEKNQSGSIRIAYFGDSIIEGDLITGRLRHLLQQKYGGTGLGFMPITSISAGFRPTINHTFAKNWEAISFMSNRRQDISLGISGFTFIPRSYYLIEKAIETEIDTLAVTDSTAVEEQPKPEIQRNYVSSPPWVRYRAVDTEGGAAWFDRIRLFYSNASDSSYVLCSLDGNPSQKHHLQRGKGVQMLDLSSGAQVKNVYLEFNAQDPIHVYGVSLDQSNGAYVDSYTIRGFSGMYFNRIWEQSLRDFHKFLDYDLVILHYGVNVSNSKVKDYSYYKKGMSQSVQHIQKALGETPILLISAHDRSIKLEGSYRTSPDIPILVNSQGEIAIENDCAFWNLFSAMGGYNSMVDYVHRNPPLAQKDHTHFNRTGANHIADMLYKNLMDKQ